MLNQINNHLFCENFTKIIVALRFITLIGVSNLNKKIENTIYEK